LDEIEDFGALLACINHQIVSCWMEMYIGAGKTSIQFKTSTVDDRVLALFIPARQNTKSSITNGVRNFMRIAPSPELTRITDAGMILL
jgi:hypothetical protein